MIDEKIFWKELMLFHGAFLLMQFEIAGICFGISAFIKKAGMGIGIGIAGLMYLLNIVANISEEAQFLKYITPFGFTEGSDIINNKEINIDYLIPGMIIMVFCIVIGYIKYSRKDISA
jgi:ABC-2 type transport system permease protein